MTELLTMIKQTDGKYMKYKKYLQYIRNVKRYGLNEHNSYLFHICIDEIQPLIEYVKHTYNTQPTKQTLDWIQKHSAN